MVIDYEGPHTVLIVFSIPTSLTLQITPITANPGDSITWSGQLTRQDGGDPGIQTINLYHETDLWDTVQTDEQGFYSGAFIAPPTEGTYPLIAWFEGAEVINIFLEPSNARKGLGIGRQASRDLKPLIYLSSVLGGYLVTKI
jgi:hypothetical protein